MNESDQSDARVLHDLREEVDAAVEEARKKAESAEGRLAASHHGAADAYESVLHSIDRRLYGGE